MAEIVIKFDTLTKKLETTLDGNSIENVNYVTIDKYNKDFHISIRTNKDEEDGIEMYTTLTANEKNDSHKYEFVEYSDEQKSIASFSQKSSIAESISSWFSNK